MLVLTRRNNESIMIGEEIEIRIVRISGNSVRVGIVAPKEVHVYRKELSPLCLSGSGAGCFENDYMHSFSP